MHSEKPAKPSIASRSHTISYFGDYILLGKIAEGGMGEVWYARQESLNRRVAIKLIKSGRLASPSDVQRFHLEAEAAAKLNHENIVQIHEVGEHEGRHYFSMELVEGGNLAEHIAEGRWRIGVENRRERQRSIARLVSTVARAVHHAHERGVLHRDIKPANILLDEGGQPHVTDFGLARLTEKDAALSQTGMIMGTPAYMAPEQAAGKTRHITTATDVYGLGAVLYELLSGRPPFQGASALEVLQMAVECDPVPARTLNPIVDRDLETICLKSLEKEPGRRYQSLARLAEDLEAWLHGVPISARPVGLLEQVWKLLKRRPAIATLTCALILTVFGAMALMGVQVKRTERARSEAVDNLKQLELRKNELQASYDVLERMLNQVVLASHDDMPEKYVAPLINEMTNSLSLLEKSPVLKIAVLRSVAFCYSGAEKLDLAVKFNRDALSLAKQSSGEQSTEVAQIMDALADLALRTGEMESAEQLSHDALAALAKDPESYTNGLHHVHFRYGIALQERGKLEAAASEFKAGLQQLNPTSDPYESQWGYSLLSRLELERRDYSSAEKWARHALAVDKTEPEDSWLAAHCVTLLGDCLTEQKEFAEAESLLQRGCNGLIRKFKSVWLRQLIIPEAVSRLTRHYLVTGQNSKIEEWEERLRQVEKQSQP